MAEISFWDGTNSNKQSLCRVDYVLCKALLILLPFNINQHITSFKRDPRLTFGVMYDGKSIYICWPLAAAKNASLLQAWTFGWTVRLATGLHISWTLGITNVNFFIFITSRDKQWCIWWAYPIQCAPAGPLLRFFCPFICRFCIPKGEVATVCIVRN